MEALSFLLSLGIAIFLFVQAPKFGKNKWLWAILGFIFGFIALGIFFIKTGKKVLGWILVILSILLYIGIFAATFIAMLTMGV
jgi:hypothetical protein